MNKFLVGLILGVAIAGGVAFYLNNMPTQFVSKVTNSNSMINTSDPIILAPGTKLQEITKESDNSKVEASVPSYDFYDILQGKKAADNKETVTQKKVVSGVVYFVQAGVFTDVSLAEDMKARLALVGFDATIKNYSIDSKVINKVIIGPLSEDEAKKIRHRLDAENIQSTIIQFNN